MKLKKSCLAVVVVAASVGSAYAAGMSDMDMSGMTHDQSMANMPGMSHMSHATMKHLPLVTKKTQHMQHAATVKPKIVPKPVKKAVTSHEPKHMDHSQMNMTGMQHDHDMSGMYMSKMDMSHMDHAQMNMADIKHNDQKPDMTHDQSMAGMDMSGMSMSHMSHADMDMGSSKGERNPDYSDGRGFGPLMPPHMMAAGVLYGVRANTLEWVQQDRQSSVATSGMAWLGTDAKRAVLNWDGHFNNRARNKLDDGVLQLTLRQPFRSFWNYDLGIRSEYQQAVQQSQGGRNRQWLAANLNGFAPYRFEVNVTALLGNQARTALKLDADYDLRITQRLVLQPEVSTDLYGKSDRDMLRGSGLSDMTGAVRLRYELSRQFAPYIGYQYSRYMGQTAKFYQAEGKDTRATQVMAGVRFWY